jgi:hypothetical protein
MDSSGESCFPCACANFGPPTWNCGDGRDAENSAERATAWSSGSGRPWHAGADRGKLGFDHFFLENGRSGDKVDNIQHGESGNPEFVVSEFNKAGYVSAHFAKERTSPK